MMTYLHRMSKHKRSLYIKGTLEDNPQSAFYVITLIKDKI